MLHFGAWPDDRSGMARVFGEPQDWLPSKPGLPVAFQGHPDSVWPLALPTISDGHSAATPPGRRPNAIHQSQWHLWKIPLASLRGLDLSGSEPCRGPDETP